MKTALLLVILIGASGVSVGLFRANTISERTEQSEAALLAVELGLDPASLSVAGFDAEGAESLLGRLAEATNLHATLNTAKSASENAAAAVTAATERLADDPGNVDLRSAYTEAQAAADRANAQIASIRDDLLDTALEGVAPSQVAALQICCEARGCAVPPAFKAIPHSAVEAAELEGCLIAEARAVRLGEQIDPSQAQRLAAIRSEMDVVVAGQRLATHLAAIEAVFAGN